MEFTPEQLADMALERDEPLIAAYQYGKNLVIYCDRCRRYHYHGLGDGERGAHCRSLDGWGGYIIWRAGDWKDRPHSWWRPYGWPRPFKLRTS